MKFLDFFLISLGAIPGAILRWQVDDNLIVNILGSFLIGFVYGLSCKQRLKLILIFGFCGSLTTFSGWIFDCLSLIIDGFIYQAIYLILIRGGRGKLFNS